MTTADEGQYRLCKCLYNVYSTYLNVGKNRLSLKKMCVCLSTNKQ